MIKNKIVLFLAFETKFRRFEYLFTNLIGVVSLHFLSRNNKASIGPSDSYDRFQYKTIYILKKTKHNKTNKKQKHKQSKKNLTTTTTTKTTTTTTTTINKQTNKQTKTAIFKYIVFYQWKLLYLCTYS